MSRFSGTIFIMTIAALASPAWAGRAEAVWHFSGVFHPVVAHFPIALLIVAGVIEVFRVRTRGRVPGDAAYVCLLLGAAGAVAAAAMGWANADASGDFNGSLAKVVTLHRWLGVTVAALAVVLSIVATIARRRPQARGLRWSVRGGAVTAAVLVGLVGSYGGKLTHGLDYYHDAYNDMITALHADEQAQSPAVASAPAQAPPTLAVVQAPLAPATVDPPADPMPAATPKSTPTSDPAPTPKPTSTQPPAADPTPTPAPPAPTPTPAVATVAGEPKIDFKTQIKPIFEAKCVKCHDEKKHKGSYRLDSNQVAFKPGSEDGQPIVRGDSEASLLVKVIEGKGDYVDEMMPPKGALLTADQVSLVRRWIDQGADWPDGQVLAPASGG